MAASDLYAQWSRRMLAVLRIMTGLLFLEHGTQKLLGFPAPANPGPPLLSLLGLQWVLELIGGLLIVLGLFTRPVAFILAGDMAVAYFMAHAPRSLLPAPCAEEPLSCPQRRRCRHPLLLRVPLSRGRRGRCVGP